MNIEIKPNGVWYHGSDQVFDELRPESTITQWRELAEAFSHQPTGLWYDDDGVIHHTDGKIGIPKEWMRKEG